MYSCFSVSSCGGCCMAGWPACVAVVCGGEGDASAFIDLLLLTERSSASDGYGGGSCIIDCCEAAFDDEDDPVDAAAGLLLLRSVGASGMENLGERGN